MTQPDYLQAPLVQTIARLLTEVAHGQLQVPRFQRRFLWTVDQRIDLLNSIRSSLPIGSLMVWRTAREEMTLDPLHTLLPSMPPAAAQPYRQYILDGHQRLGTLYRALAPGLLQTMETPPDASDDTHGDPDEWPIYYDLEDLSFEIVRRSRREHLRLTLFPMDHLLDPMAVFRHQQQLFSAPLDTRLAYRIEHFAARFREYMIPSLILASDDLEVVTTTFSRLNSAGTVLTEVDLLTALTWGGKLDLRAHLERIQQQLAPTGWVAITDKQIMQALKAVAGFDLTRTSLRELNDHLIAHPERFDEVANALRHAAHFLTEVCHIPGPGLLPYSVQLPLVASLLHADPERAAHPRKRDALRRWFWATTYAEWFAAVNASRVRTALDTLTCFEFEPEDSPAGGTINDLIHAHPLAYERFDSGLRAARARAQAILLAELHPRDADDTPLDTARLLLTHKGRALKIWQSEYVGYQYPVPANSVANRLLLDPATATAFLARLHDTANPLPTSVLRSHGFPDSAIESIHQGDLISALDHRATHLEGLEACAIADAFRAIADDPDPTATPDPPPDAPP